MVQHIGKTCDLPFNKGNPKVLCKDNAVCIAWLNGGYIKRDRTKYISPKFFFTLELQKKGEKKGSSNLLQWQLHRFIYAATSYNIWEISA